MPSISIAGKCWCGSHTERQRSAPAVWPAQQPPVPPRVVPPAVAPVPSTTWVDRMSTCQPQSELHAAHRSHTASAGITRSNSTRRWVLRRGAPKFRHLLLRSLQINDRTKGKSTEVCLRAQICDLLLRSGLNTYPVNKYQKDLSRIPTEPG